MTLAILLMQLTIAPVTPISIYDIISKIPSECALTNQCKPSFGYHLSKDAKVIAKIIAETATSKREAVEMAVYSSYESGNSLDAEGDRGKSHGAWQIQIAGLDGRNQLAHWIRLRNYSIARCSDNPEGERMALLASGSCAKGRAKVRKRDELVNQLVEGN
jgi:hypothetical protein